MNESLERYFNCYFIGIGGIGMSNLARYFLAEGKTVGGYDRVQSPLTDALTKEGAFIHYEDNIDAVPQQFLDKERTLIVYTPCRSFQSFGTEFFPFGRFYGDETRTGFGRDFQDERCDMHFRHPR